MFWIGFLVGILVIPALAFFTLAILFSIDLIPYTIEVIKKYFKEKRTKKGLDSKANKQKVEITKAEKPSEPKTKELNAQ